MTTVVVAFFLTPAMIIVWVLGLSMAYSGGWFASGWLHAKLALVVVLIAYHWQCGRLVRTFKEDRNLHGHVYYRWFNEIPVVALIAIVLLVVFKPY